MSEPVLSEQDLLVSVSSNEGSLRDNLLRYSITFRGELVGYLENDKAKDSTRAFYRKNGAWDEAVYSDLNQAKRCTIENVLLFLKERSKSVSKNTNKGFLLSDKGNSENEKQ